MHAVRCRKTEKEEERLWEEKESSEKITRGRREILPDENGGVPVVDEA